MAGKNKENFYLIKVSETKYAIFNFDTFPTFDLMSLNLGSKALSKPFKCNIFCSGTKVIMESTIQGILKEYTNANIITLGYKDTSFNSIIQSLIKDNNLNKSKVEVKEKEKDKKKA